MAKNSSFANTMELLWAARSGEAGALDQVIRRYQGRVLARIRTLMGPSARRHAESMDFMQGAFTDLVRSLPDLVLENEHAVLDFMIAVARNNIRDSVRRKHERSFESFSLSIARRLAVGVSPSAEAEHNERQRCVIEALEAMTENHRRVIELRDLEGMSFKEIGKSMGKTEDAVFMLHARAMVSLGGILKSRGIGDRHDS